VTTGDIVASGEAHNLVTNAGLNLVRDLLDGDSVAGITHFAVGTGTAAVTALDTALGTEVFRDVAGGRTSNAQQLVLSYYLNSADANGNTLSEAGLFNAASAGTMFARVALSPPITKTAAVAVSFFWTINLGAA
jgi:hypothetical protein